MPLTRGTWLKKLTQTSSTIKMIVVITLLCMIMAAITGRQIVLTRQETLAKELNTTQNLARSLSHQVEGIFWASTILLHDLSTRVETEGTDPESLAKLTKVMARHLAQNPKINGMGILNAQGISIARARPSTPAGINNSDRSFFNDRRVHNDTETHIDGPVISKVDGKGILITTLRLNHPDGSFAGVAFVTILSDEFQTMFDQIDLAPHGVINLASDRGQILIHRPFIDLNDKRDISNTPYFMSGKNKEIEYTTDVISTIDHINRIGTTHKIPEYHLQLGVSFSKDESLSNWRQRTIYDLLFLSTIFIGSPIICWIIWRQALRKEADDANYRLLTENSKDVIICLNERGDRTFISPSFWSMTGWKPEQLQNKPASNFIAPEDRPIVANAIALLVSGKETPPYRYRYILADGGFLWVEAVVKRAETLPDQPTRFVLNIRDISDTKQTEDALLEANTQLMALSLTDALTGINNRRKFDDVLNHEWKRSIRQQSPLGLILIDIDKFKDYNDFYGHVAGDQCLTKVAKILEAGLNRPGDLVARFGGEEFGIILADMPCEQIAILAENLRLALIDLRIPHERNDEGVLTISLGLAIVTPQADEDPKLLIDMADGALYQAKKSGRNQTIIA